MRASASDALAPADASAALGASTSSEPVPVMTGRKPHPPSPSNDYLGHRGHLTEALRAPDGRPPARSRSDPSPAEPPRQHRVMGGIVTAPDSLAGAAPTIIGANPPVSATADCTCAPRTRLFHVIRHQRSCPSKPSCAPQRVVSPDVVIWAMEGGIRGSLAKPTAVVSASSMACMASAHSVPRAYWSTWGLVR